MAANKNLERFATFEVGVPQSGNANITIASGEPLLFGNGLGSTKPIACVAVEATNSTNPPYDNNSPYITVDCEGVYNLTVQATSQKSPSAGAAINPGDAIFADGGTYDPLTGVTHGITLDVDTTGVFFGRSMDALAAGLTGTLRIILRNAC